MVKSEKGKAWKLEGKGITGLGEGRRQEEREREARGWRVGVEDG